MTLPALRAMSPSQYQAVHRSASCSWSQADKRLGLFEWTLHQILLRHLRPQFEPVRPPQIVYYGLQQLGEPCSVLLSALARASQRDDRGGVRSGRAAAAGSAAAVAAGRGSAASTNCNAALEQLAQVGAEAAGTAGRRLRGVRSVPTRR